MTRLRPWLIAAALLSATHPSGRAAEPVHAAVTGEFSEQAEQLVQPRLQRQTLDSQSENGALFPAGYAQQSPPVPPLSAQRYLASDWVDSEPAGPGRIQGKAAGGRLDWRDAVLASHAVQPPKRMEIGLGLSTEAIAMGWYGVYLKGLDRVAERNTIYGLLRETPSPGLNDSKAPPAFCCQRSDTPTSLEQFANAIAAREVSPTFFLFGMLRKKGWNFNLEDGWRLQARVPKKK